MAAKKKEGADPSKLAEIRALMNSINRKQKKEVIRFADDASATYYLRRPSGIMQLDIDTGGGLPAGAFSTIAGPNQAGKTLLLYKYFAMHQRLYGNESYLALAMPEGQIDYEYARAVGWRIAVPDEIIESWQEARRLRGAELLTKAEVAELKVEIGTNIRIDGDTGEEVLDNLYDIIKSGMFGIVGLDSLESLLPDAEAKLDTLDDNPQQAAHANIVSRFLKRYGPISNGSSGQNFTSFVSTCQVRSNRKRSEVQSHLAKYMKEWAETVPMAVRHWRHIDVVVQSGEKLWKGSGQNKVLIGKAIKWEIAKGKAGTHDGITGEIDFYYDRPGFTDDLNHLIMCGVKYGVIKEAGGLYTLVRSRGPDPHLNEVPDLDTFAEEIAKSLELELVLRQEILAAAGKNCVYR